MATQTNTPISLSPQFTTLHTNWKAALKAANSFPGKDAHAYRMDAQVDDRAAILLETPALNLSDIAKKFAILEHYICIGGDHGNDIVSLAFQQIKFDFKKLAHLTSSTRWTSPTGRMPVHTAGCPSLPSGVESMV